MPQSSLLSIIIFLPLLGGLAALGVFSQPRVSRWIAAIAASGDLALVILLFFLVPGGHAAHNGGWLMAEDYPWLQSLGIRYSLGLDGISLMLILLTAFLALLCILVSWRQINTKVGSFHFFLLATQTGVLGVFLATDLFLFYLFWEVQIIPVFFLVGIWGHEKRLAATMKFILFTVSGSLLMLIALTALYVIHGTRTGIYTFSLARLASAPLTDTTGIFLFAAFMIAFAVKTPIIPLHIWLPDTHTEAPTAGSVVLAGLLLKTGVYGILRIAFPLFPTAARLSMPLLLTLGLVGLFYAAWIALSQTNIKRLIAYSSIAHMGLIIIGLAIWKAITVSGAVLQMINHGLTTSALFILVGILGERIDSRKFADLGGLWKKMPVFSAFFLFFAMASLGLPGLNNFVGEILILIGAFTVSPLVAILGFCGMVFTLVYVLRLVQDSLFGREKAAHPLYDLTIREGWVLGVLAAAVLFIGLHPGPILRLFETPLHHLLSEGGPVAVHLAQPFSGPS